MQFSSLSYLLFLAVVVAIGFAWSGNRPGGKRLFLLLASYFFYATIDFRFVFVVASVTLIAYFGARWIEQAKSQKAKRRVLFGLLVVLVSTLAVFRYVPVLPRSVLGVLDQLGLSPDTVLGEWFIPLGISFYTFVAIGYLIDIYRGESEAESDFVQVALFLSFFPQILSGPIARASHLVPQIKAMRRPTVEQFESGVGLMLRGFAKKLILADYIGTYLVSPAFDQTQSASAVALVIGIYAYTLQIYFDLSGYTDLARGAGKMLGIDLYKNFNAPYRSRSVSEFWQRWHISMSSFFRDYLYFGLGGSRRGNVYLNVMLTFVAIGIWHGAGWNYAIYGLLHGSMVCLERVRGTNVFKSSSVAYTVWSMFLTFHFVVASRLLFREEDLRGAGAYLARLFDASAWATATHFNPLALLAMAVGAAIVFAPKEWGDAVRMSYRRASPVWKSALIAGVAWCCVAVSPNPRAFVYFQF